MPTRQTILTEAAALVGDAVRERGVSELGTYVDIALRDLDRYSPRHAKTTITGDGTDEYDLGDRWDAGFSMVERVRWVPGADFNTKAIWLTKEQYEVEFAHALRSAEAVGTGDGTTKEFALDYPFAVEEGAAVTVSAVAVTAIEIEGGEDASTLTFDAAPANAAAIVATYYTEQPQIRFAFSPSSSDRVVVEHTTRHAITDNVGSTTLNDRQAAALAHKAAALLLLAAAGSMAATVAQNTDSDFVGQAVGTAGDAYRRLADVQNKAFFEALGVSEDQQGGTAASAPVFCSVPATPNARNNDYLTHPRRRPRVLGAGI